MISRPILQFPRIGGGCRRKCCEPRRCRAPCVQYTSCRALEAVGYPPLLVVPWMTYLLNGIRPPGRIGWTIEMVRVMASLPLMAGIRICA